MSGQLWGTNELGGFMYSDQLSDKIREELKPMVQYRQHCDAKDGMDKGYNTGDLFHWNVYSKIANQGGKILENEEMPESNYTITQGTLQVTEYGQSVPFNSKLDDMSKHSVEEIIDLVLKDDAAKAFDIDARAQFDATKRTVVATAAGTASVDNLTWGTDGTAGETNDAALDKYHLKAIVDEMKESNIPTFQGGDYFAIARPSTYRNLKNEMEALHQYVDQGFRMIMNGEIGRYEGMRFIEQTNIDNVGFSGSKSDTVHFFGKDTVAEAIVCPEEIRGKIPTDFGRSKGVAWYAIGGFGLVHTDATNSRIIEWTCDSV
jgi:N4-gp56 family major capsid protein